MIDGVQNASLKIKELKAQILYRLEKYEDCFAVYRDIIKNSNDDYEDERETNLAAVLSNLALEGSVRPHLLQLEPLPSSYNRFFNSQQDLEVPSLREETYELTYNAAHRLVAQGINGDRSVLAEAEKKLRTAEKMCREALEEDGASEEDIEDEIGIIKVQLGYCLQLQGRDKEAHDLYLAALKAKPDDVALVAVASNNLVTLNKDQNVFDSKKRMRNATHEGLEHKLTSRQRKSIAYNQCLLTMYTNQVGRRLIDTLYDFLRCSDHSFFLSCFRENNASSFAPNSRSSIPTWRRMPRSSKPYK